MADWNAAQYLMFDNKRTQPALDLLSRLNITDPRKIIDIGCGPGNSTSILRKRFPKAVLTGIDSSSNMIEKAAKNCPDISFMLCDAEKELDKLGTDYDLVFSNACIQWIPGHEQLIPNMFGLLNNGGVLAVQAPMNGDSPLYRIIDNIVSNDYWGFTGNYAETNKMLEPARYFDILSKLSGSFSMWETVYYHRMRSHRDLTEWVKATRLRPYLDVLNDNKQAELLNEIREQAKTEYEIQSNGEIIFRFNRFFFTAVRE